MVLGDIRAQLAAVDAGERGYLDLIAPVRRRRAGRARGRAPDPVRADGPPRDRVVPRRRLPPGQLDRQRQRRTRTRSGSRSTLTVAGDGITRRFRGHVAARSGAASTRRCRSRGRRSTPRRGSCSTARSRIRPAISAPSTVVADEGTRRQPGFPGGVRGARDHRVPGHGCGHRARSPRRCPTASRPTARAATRSSRSARDDEAGNGRSSTSTCSRVRAAPGPATTGRRACRIRARTTRTCRSRSPRAPTRSTSTATASSRIQREPRAVARLAGARPRVRLSRRRHARPGPVRQAGAPPVRARRRRAGPAVDDDGRPRRRGDRADR